MIDSLRALMFAAAVLGAATSEAAAATETVIYAFKGGIDGEAPTGKLAPLNGLIYGTTSAGGDYYTNRTGAGTVFSVSISGTKTTLHSFGGPHDGKIPWGGLTAQGAILFGTTQEGGKENNDHGSFFSISPVGEEKILHSFSDEGAAENFGAVPYDAPTPAMGAFIVTTAGGAVDGEVIGISETGRVTPVYSFLGGTDGGYPVSGVKIIDGTIYGATYYGGGSSGCDVGCGTVYSVTPSGVEHVLHAFSGGNDGANPSSELIYVNGTFYGTTPYGGKYGAGTVFSVTPRGNEQVLHSFGSARDGAYPVAGLLEFKGKLYGTTPGGGQNQEGTIFSMTLSGKEKVAYSFAGGNDGSAPSAPLIEYGGYFYGTTSGGGGCGAGCGTVFQISP